MTSDRPRRKRRTRVLVIVAVNLLILCVLAVLAECVLRLAEFPFSGKAVPMESELAQFDPQLGWSYRKATTIDMDYGGETTQIHLDWDGIRVPRAGHRLSALRPSVLFIGGSFTMGHALSYEDSFVGQFEALDGMPYQAVNLGVQAYGSDQALLALQRFLPKFDTKVVVYTFVPLHIMRNGNHDRRLLHPSASFLGTKPRFALDGDGKLYLADRPALYEDYRHSWLLDALKISVGAKLGVFPPRPEGVTRGIIRQMQAYCQANGARFVVLHWRWTDDEYDRLFESLDVEVIDTLDDAPPGWQDMTIPDGHPNRAAGGHVTQLLLEYFRRNKLQ